jgi:Ca2+-binding EF-hand superfamily protein
MFESDRRSCEVMLRLCKPETITEPEYIIFKLNHRLSKLGKDVDSLFNMLDEDKGGTISREEFLAKARVYMDMPISDNDLGKAFNYIDADNDNLINKEEFCVAVNFTSYQNKQKS